MFRLGRSASYNDVAEVFGVSEGAVWTAVNTRFVEFLLEKYMQPQIADRWPTTPEMCASYAAAMATRTRDPDRPMQGCIGALDGTLIPIWCKVCA